MTRPYTGNSDAPAARLRPGMKAFIDRVVYLSDGALWNNGDFGVRDMRGKAGQMSVHATGRACDFSYRKMGSKGKDNGRQHATQWCKILVDNADVFEIECILDYFPKPHGRGWRCDRGKWTKYTKATISGAPGGDWLHIEISPRMAGDPALVHAAFAKVFGA